MKDRYVYYNPNFKNKRVGDCVVRAISKVLNQSWEESHLSLCLQSFCMADMPSSNAVWDAYLKRKGFIREVIPNECNDCYTVEDFCEDYPDGVYVVGTGSHAIAVVNGHYFDAWDSGREQPIYYYRRSE